MFEVAIEQLKNQEFGELDEDQGITINIYNINYCNIPDPREQALREAERMVDLLFTPRLI